MEEAGLSTLGSEAGHHCTSQLTGRRLRYGQGAVAKLCSSGPTLHLDTDTSSYGTPDTCACMAWMPREGEGGVPQGGVPQPHPSLSCSPTSQRGDLTAALICIPAKSHDNSESLKILFNIFGNDNTL